MGKSWSFTAKPCDSCSAAPGAVFCRADSAFLCASCDVGIHAAAASPHASVPVCDVCEQAPAAVTCKADSAALCASCDADIHSANPLAARHERIPVVPFFDTVSVPKSSASASSASADEFSEEEAEAASWLLADPNNKFEGESGSPEYKNNDCLFDELDPYLDLVLVPGKQKPVHAVNEEKLYASDGVVPVQHGSDQYPGTVVDGFPAYNVGYPGSKPLIIYNFTSQSISQSVCS
ncbi:Zinc finger protein CONSTANS-like [Orobanche gracilis]